MNTGCISILSDGGAHGLGHLSRASALGWALKTRAHRVHVKALSDRGQALLPPSPQEEGHEGLVVFDLPYEIEPFFTTVQEKKVPTVALDYFGSCQPTLTISILERPHPAGEGRRLSGLSYAIIRKEIKETSPVHPGQGVLVTIGGGDLKGVGPGLAHHLAEQGEDVTLIEGPLRSAPYEKLSPRVRCCRSPSDLPERMARCRWAVTNGGITLMEMMYLGKAVHVVPQTADEERLARHILSEGGLLGVGPDSLSRPSGAKLEEVRTIARRLIDGQGAERVSAAIEELL